MRETIILIRGKQRIFLTDNLSPPWLFQILPVDEWDKEKYTEVVMQHFLGMTYESRPMYYLKVRRRLRVTALSKDICLLFRG